MDLGISGKKALILASSKGLGKGVALELAREGAEVMICGRDEQALAMTKSEIEAVSSTPVHSIVGDIATSRGRSAISEAVKKELGSVDILITNTGGPPPGNFEDVSLDDWENAYRLLIESAVGIIQDLLPDMKKKGWGRIVSITSMSIQQPVNGLILSNAVRSTFLGLVKSLSNELAPYNITVNNVLPGYTNTDRLKNLIKANPNFDKAVATVPLGRIAEVREFAQAVTFLASDCASYITGVSLPVDGGWIKGV